MVKLKKKLIFDGHVYFEPVSLSKLESALLFLKANNSLYHDISIDLSNIDPNLMDFPVDENIDIEIVNEESDIEDPLNDYRSRLSESCMVTDIQSQEYIEHNDIIQDMHKYEM